MSEPKPVTPPPVLPYATPALSPEQMSQLVAARKLGGKLHRAVSVAKTDAWTTAIFGAITLLLSLGSVPGMVLGAGMMVIGWRQSRAADRLKKLDEGAPRQLVQNQLLLGVLLFVYGAVSLVMAIHSPVSLSAEVGGMDAEVGRMLSDYDELAQTLYLAVYVGVMVLAIIVPGLTALYYHRQGKRIAEYRRSTPGWILSLQDAGVRI